MRSTPSPATAGGREPLTRCCLALVLIATLSACATGNGEGADVYRSDGEFVRLVPIEAGAPANAHPFGISAGQLRKLLAGLRVSRAASIDAEPVFTDQELATVVPPLVSALSRAAPNQDVVFAVTGHRGMFGRFSPESVTTGRLFARGDALHLIFGLMQARLDTGELDYTYVSPAVEPGSRSRDAGKDVWALDPGRGEFHEARRDWLVFDRTAIPEPEPGPARALPTETAPAGAPAPDTGPGDGTATTAEEIERRLRVLDSLRERGVITDAEYLERRRAILDEL